MNLTHPKLIKLKAALFLIIMLVASILLLSRSPELTSALLLGTACRSYVLHHDVDPSFNYRGLWNLTHYLISPSRFKDIHKINR